MSLRDGSIRCAGTTVLVAVAALAVVASASCSSDESRPELTEPVAATESDPEADGDSQAVAPSKSDPGAYTQFVVQRAIDRYDAEGLDAALDHSNNPENLDDQWYVFVIDADGTVLGHPDEGLRGESLHGWVGTDVNGYQFGAEMLAADETGHWVPYVYINPPAGTSDIIKFELKNAWVKRRDGLLFGSGWYINAEQFLPALITEAAEHFRIGGLEETLAFYNHPQGISAGLIPTAAYYNRTNSLDGYFAGFIAAPDGEILSHFDSGLIGTQIKDLLGPAIRSATAQGAWVTEEDNPPNTPSPQTMRIYVIDVDGTLIGGGWYRS